ncbi:MFS transporter [Streptomyces lunaelactis]|uniref:MFS transporter n=1 Tax=Streptomyces lunaelactis TaxID=1535768 RepID=UPI0015859EE7|nr:MFS transporter [Streptomyces lunaelactis]NUK03039.1 MFS transporter [Streptomyces lunaelactis]NUK25243.1 MFS transporter [Streptomyces lunaelactis]NUK36073.1 MFS transporter [Streptomyces lunaelactis]NUK42699.1 MFS transporter [Streptomyces lunaelactis]NUK58882.1 MFS transporter [Streptomyces lunaelactis]
MSTGSGAHSAPAPTADDTTHSTTSKTTMFSSLKIRNYRLFATGQVVSNTGTWMQRIAQDWLVLTLTGSASAVGITIALQFLPMLLFGLYGGVLADRLPKRQLLLATQTAMGLTGLALAVLTLTGHVQVWHVYLTAFVLGLVTVVDNPARQSFVAEMVGPDQLGNAVSLNSANFQSARLVGPAVAGVLITAVGSGFAFLLNGLSFIAPIAGLLLMRNSELYKIERAPRGKGQLREGLKYVAGRPELIWPIVLVGFIGTFGFNFPIWLSAFVDDVYHSGASTYGLLNTLMAAGSLAGALLAARRGTSRLRVLVGAAVLFGLLEIVTAFAPQFWIFAVLMVPIGVFGLTVNVTANSILQMATEPAMRGRVMSLFMMVFVGGTPLGAPLVGWITDTYGPRIGFAAGGAVALAAAIGVGVMLVRVGGLRLKIDLRPGRRHVEFVPREQLATAA